MKPSIHNAQGGFYSNELKQVLQMFFKHTKNLNLSTSLALIDAYFEFNSKCLFCKCNRSFSKM